MDGNGIFAVYLTKQVPLDDIIWKGNKTNKEGISP